jgi:8-oxo-dGTP pyrophosphatase MutT (NUDIX family)
MSQWKIVSQKPIFKAKLFCVKEIKLENDAGGKAIHYQAERIPIVTVFPLTSKYEIYLISEYRYMFGKRVLEAVSGHIGEKESAIVAARRELKEEAGMEADQLEEIARIQMAGSVFKNTSNLFLAKGLVMGDNNLDEGEDISVVKMPLSQAVEKVMTGEITNATSMIGILMLDKLRAQKRL